MHMLPTIRYAHIHLYFTVDRHLSVHRVSHKVVTDTSVPPRALAFKQERNYTLHNIPLRQEQLPGHREYQGEAQPKLIQHNLTTSQSPPRSLGFLTKTSFPLTRNWTLNGPEIAKAFAIFLVASFT